VNVNALSKAINDNSYLSTTAPKPKATSRKELFHHQLEPSAQNFLVLLVGPQSFANPQNYRFGRLFATTRSCLMHLYTYSQPFFSQMYVCPLPLSSVSSLIVSRPLTRCSASLQFVKMRNSVSPSSKLHIWCWYKVLFQSSGMTIAYGDRWLWVEIQSPVSTLVFWYIQQRYKVSTKLMVKAYLALVIYTPLTLTFQLLVNVFTVLLINLWGMIGIWSNSIGYVN